MNVKESGDVQCNSSSDLEAVVDNVVVLLKNQEEEAQKIEQKKQSLEIGIEIQKRHLEQLEMEKSELDAEVTVLKLRNIAYQKEHTNLRNAITVVRFQIEKIKESIANVKAKDLKNLEEFEKAVDDITDKFRSGPDIYDRKILLDKIQKEKEKKQQLIEKLDELKNSFEAFNTEKGLRSRTDDKEDLMNCILPGSELFSVIEMTKILEEVTNDMKTTVESMKQRKTDFPVAPETK